MCVYPLCINTTKSQSISTVNILICVSVCTSTVLHSTCTHYPRPFHFLPFTRANWSPLTLAHICIHYYTYVRLQLIEAKICLGSQSQLNWHSGSFDSWWLNCGQAFFAWYGHGRNIRINMHWFSRSNRTDCSGNSSSTVAAFTVAWTFAFGQSLLQLQHVLHAYRSSVLSSNSIE